jgi:hypothetical protein
MSAIDDAWTNIPSAMTSALQVVVSSLESQQKQIHALEQRVQSHADTESEVRALSALSSQQSEALRNLAASLERLSVATSKGEAKHQQDSENIWRELRRLESSKVSAGAKAASALDKTVDEVERRLSHLEQQVTSIVATNAQRSSFSGGEEKLQMIEGELALLRREVSTKLVGTQEIEASLARKAAWADVEVLVSGKADKHLVTGGLRAKADACELEKLASMVSSAVTRDETRHLLRNEIAPVVASVAQCELECRTLRKDAGGGLVSEGHGDTASRGYGRRRSEVPKEARRAADEAWVREVSSEEATRALEARARRDDLNATAMAERIEATLRSDLEAFRVQVHEYRAADKAETGHMSRLLEERVNQEAAAVAQSSTEVVRVLNLKAYKSDVTKALKTKANCEVLDEMRADLQKKADGQEVRQALNRTADMLQVLLGDLKDMQGQGVQGAASANQERAKLSSALQELKGQMESEAGRVAKMVEDKTTAKVRELAEDQEAIIARLEASVLKAEKRSLAESPPMTPCRGRWLWRSGNLRDGWCPWEAQAANTAPSVFTWQPEQPTTITSTVPGLYHLSVGFFTHASATIIVCVNGEPVLTRAPSSTETSMEMVDSSFGDCVMRRSRHSVGDVTSIALNEFLALPAPAALSVRFSASGRAQGFLMLEKL